MDSLSPDSLPTHTESFLAFTSAKQTIKKYSKKSQKKPSPEEEKKKTIEEKVEDIVDADTDDGEGELKLGPSFEIQRQDSKLALGDEEIEMDQVDEAKFEESAEEVEEEEEEEKMEVKKKISPGKTALKPKLPADSFQFEESDESDKEEEKEALPKEEPKEEKENLSHKGRKMKEKEEKEEKVEKVEEKKKKKDNETTRETKLAVKRSTRAPKKNQEKEEKEEDGEEFEEEKKVKPKKEKRKIEKIEEEEEGEEEEEEAKGEREKEKIPKSTRVQRGAKSVEEKKKSNKKNEIAGSPKKKQKKEPTEKEDKESTEKKSSGKGKAVEKSSKATKTKKEPTTLPKRPPSAYIMFSSENRESMKKKHPDLSNAELLRKLGEAWKNADEETKLKYKNAAVVARREYNKETKEFAAKVGPKQKPAVDTKKRKKVQEEEEEEKESESDSEKEEKPKKKQKKAKGNPKKKKTAPEEIKYFVVTSALSAKEEKKLIEAQKFFSDIEVSNTFDVEFTTHVVLGGEEKRTLKVLAGLAKGCWIVSFKWIADSLKDGEWKPEKNYEISKWEGAKASRKLPSRLFVGMKFFVHPMSDPPSQTVEEILTAAGGEIVTSVSEADLCLSSNQVVSDSEDEVIVNVKWIFDSLSKCKKLPYSDYNAKIGREEAKTKSPRSKSPKRKRETKGKKTNEY